ncbi:type I-E CRISPR-associated protein Cse1/CasA [Nonomuraea maheshkhaliensis]|uniref:type I-E CRISPR-associated protein Cse1/CasA n=1 Tax=Nonomuraea maheshkhaliensis TaxID=419590 RepID=UPI003D15554C
MAWRWLVPRDSETPSFDLTRRPWLPVQRRDGSEEELSLEEVFAQADNLRRLVGDVPTQEFALLRLLLAILHDAIDGPQDVEEWQALWEDGLPISRISDYLSRQRDRLDLLHPGQPFLQTPGLRAMSGEIARLDRIIADVPNGARYFTMRARGAERLSFAEAARWLVHTHAFDTAGIKTGVVCDPRVKGGRAYPQGVGWAGTLGGVMAEGHSLRETLLLNLIAFDTDNLRLVPERDAPAWRREPNGPGQMDALELSRRPAGVRDLYTWPSRRVRLVHDSLGVTGVVLTYGDPLSPVNKHQHEPMTGWRRSPAQEKKLGLAQVYMPREHDPSRSAWRGLGALIAGYATGGEQRGEDVAVVRPRVLDWVARLTVEGDLPPDFLIRARLVGAVYGTQQSVIDEIIDDAVSMPVVLLYERDSGLGQHAIGAVGDAEAAVTVLGNFAFDLATACGAEGEPPKSTARHLGFSALDGPFRAWLAGLRAGDDAQERRTAWQQQVHRIISRQSDALMREAGDAAWRGRVIETKKGQELWLTDSQADWAFRGRLRKVLPLAVTDESDTDLRSDSPQNVEARA